ncbi:MAG: mechanosensitive ion channel family protein, partial [Myxococcota bacterium]
VEGQMVKVVMLGIRTTVARTLDDEDLIVPNSTLVQSSVKNLTLRDTEYRMRVRVGVAYSSDMAEVDKALLRAAESAPGRLPSFDPRVLLLEFGSSSVDWEVSIWIGDPWRVRVLRSELLLAVWRELQAAGITIAFPQLDVHIDPEVERALAGPADRTGR